MGNKEVYGDIVLEGDKYKTTGAERTGCIFCMYGVHLEKGENRFQKLKKSHPELHNYCMNKLNLKQVLDYMNIKY